MSKSSPSTLKTTIFFFTLRNPTALYAYLKERLHPNKMTYIFLDEVQRCEKFPEVVDSLTLKKNVDIYLTGSNATMLSSEIATLLSGRYVEIRMLRCPFPNISPLLGKQTTSPALTALIWKQAPSPTRLNSPTNQRSYAIISTPSTTPSLSRTSPSAIKSVTR